MGRRQGCVFLFRSGSLLAGVFGFDLDVLISDWLHSLGDVHLPPWHLDFCRTADVTTYCSISHGSYSARAIGLSAYRLIDLLEARYGRYGTYGRKEKIEEKIEERLSELGKAHCVIPSLALMAIYCALPR